MRQRNQLGSVNVKFEERGVELDILEKIKAEKNEKSSQRIFIILSFKSKNTSFMNIYLLKTLHSANTIKKRWHSYGFIMAIISLCNLNKITL